MGNREIIEAHYAAGAQGDLAGMMADFDPRIRWVEAAGFPLVFAVIAGEWDGFGMRVDELHEDGDTVIAIGRYVATHRRSGRALDARTVHIWRLTGGRITGFEQLTDTRLVAEAAEGDAA